MKKRVRNLCVILLVLSMLFALAGCGSAGSSNNGEAKDQNTSVGASQNADAGTVAESTEQPEVQPSDTGTGDSNTLVVYFSRTGEQYTVGVIDEGNTAIVAKMIADQTGADLFEVLPVDDYYPMTYDELTEVAKQEQNDNARPAYAGEVPDLSQYDTIFIGAPVWWGDWPMIMYTFFENNADALAGKTLIPFSTHEGSGLSGFET